MNRVPTVFHVKGRDLFTLNPDVWSSVMGHIGGVFATMPYAWRWITISTPATLDAQRQRLREERAHLGDPTQRERRLATYFQLQDLERSRGLRRIQHYLAVWPETQQQREVLRSVLNGPLGGVTPLAEWPSLFPAAEYRDTGRALLALDGSHAWRALLSTEMQGSILPNFFYSALMLPFPLIVAVDVFTYTRDAAQQALEWARQQIEANSALYRNYDETRKQARSDWEGASGLIQRQGALLHRVQVAVLAHGASVSEAITHGQQVAHTVGHVVPLRGMEGYQSAVASFLQPTPTSEIPAPRRPHNMVTHQVTALVPWGIVTDLRQDGLLLGLDEQRRVPVLRRVEQLAAMHAYFVGMTGSGKSSYAATLAHRLVDGWNYQVICVDPQGAFRPFAAAHRGSSYNRLSFLPLGNEPPLQINPLDPITDDLDLGLIEQVTHVEQLLTWLNGVPLTMPQAVRLRAALTVLYASLQGMALDEPAAIPRLSHLQRMLERQGPDTTGLQEIISQWTTEPLCRLFDRPTSLNLRMDRSTPVIVYDLSDPTLPQRYKTFFATLICAAIQRALRRQPRPCIVILDEAGVQFNEPQLAGFAENLAKTIRRFRGSLWLIDQTLELLNTHAGREVFKNSFINVLGLLKSDEAPLLRELFPMLTEEQIKLTTGVGLSEEQMAQRAGHYTLILNNQVFSIYNHLSSLERQLLPQKAVEAYPVQRRRA